MNYDKIALAAKNLARDILRSQMLARIQSRLEKAQGALNSAIRTAAKHAVDRAEEDKKKAEDDQKRADRRKAFAEALTSVATVSADELSAAQAAVKETYDEADKNAADEAKSVAAARADQDATDAKNIQLAREEVARLAQVLADANAGKIKVDAEELSALTAKLIEDGRVTDLESISSDEA